MQKKPQTTKHCKEQRSDRKIINRHEIFIKRINICYQTYKSSISSNLSSSSSLVNTSIVIKPMRYVISHAKLQISVWMFVSGWKWYNGTKNCPPPFPCCPVSRQCPWKKILIEKKTYKNSLIDTLIK